MVWASVRFSSRTRIAMTAQTSSLTRVCVPEANGWVIHLSMYTTCENGRSSRGTWISLPRIPLNWHCMMNERINSTLCCLYPQPMTCITNAILLNWLCRRDHEMLKVKMVWSSVAQPSIELLLSRSSHESNQTYWWDDPCRDYGIGDGIPLRRINEWTEVVEQWDASRSRKLLTRAPWIIRHRHQAFEDASLSNTSVWQIALAKKSMRELTQRFLPL